MQVCALGTDISHGYAKPALQGGEWFMRARRDVDAAAICLSNGQTLRWDADYKPGVDMRWNAAGGYDAAAAGKRPPGKPALNAAAARQLKPCPTAPS